MIPGILCVFLLFSDIFNVKDQAINMETRATETTAIQMTSPLSTFREHGLNVIDGKVYPLPHALALFNNLPTNVFPATMTTATTDRYLYELNGLILPFQYDCEQWGSHPYFQAVPSRFVECARQTFLQQAGIPIIAQYWVIDEEIFEFNSILKALLEFQEHHITRKFVIFELGARWGTWGARAMMAARVLGFPVFSAYWEPLDLHCEGLQHVHNLNGFSRDTYFLQCDIAEESSVSGKMREHKCIDVFDVDIQGAESGLLPLLKDEIERSVHYLIIGTHSAQIHESMVSLFGHWKVLTNTAMNRETACINEELRRRRNYTAVFEKHCYTDSSIGPIANWDGELILENPVFSSRCFPQ
jgi:hypothetical protein